MNRSILSTLALAVAVSVSACNKNTSPRTKPVPGPPVTEERKPKRPVDEDTYVKEKPKNSEVVDPTAAEKNKIPPAPTPNTPEYAGKADGKPGYVQSPYDSQKRLIDVRGLPPGTEAECPYTRRTFLVPP